MSRRKNRITVLALLILCVVTVSVILSGFAYDIHRDRQRALSFDGPVRVFERGASLGNGRSDVVAVLQQGDSARVLRIWYGKDYECVKIELPDRRIGYLISGESGNYKITSQ